MTLGAVVALLESKGLNAEEFIRGAALVALREVETRELDSAHEQGYRRIPVQPDEFAVEFDESLWSDL